MSTQKVEMTVEQKENGQYVEQVAYPYVEYEHVTMENGMDIMSMIRDDVSTPMVTHNTTSWKVGQGDSDVSETIVDSSVGDMAIKGQTYQNILPSPSLRNSMTNGKTMQRLNEGCDSVNTVDGVCKSAILKGCTKYTNDNGDVFDKFFTPIIVNWSSGYVDGDGTIADGGHYVTQFIDIAGFDGFNFGIDETRYAKIGFYDENKTFISRSMGSENGTHGIVMSQTFPPNTKYIRASFTTKNVYFKDFYNRDLTLPLSLSNVKMPVLTTTGKNLFDYEDFKNTVLSGGATTKYPINLEPNTTYTFSDKTGLWNGSNGYYVNLHLIDENDVKITQLINSNLANRKSFTFTTSNSNEYYLLIHKNNMNSMDMASSDFQIEQGTQATTYEPFKTNILSTSEDVTLRGVGDVQDTLDLMTGEVISLVEEVVLNGSDNGVSYSLMNTNTSDYLVISCWFDYSTYRKRIGSHLSTLPFGSGNNSDILDNPYFGGAFYGDFSVPNKYVIKIEKSKLISPDLDGFKDWLSKNPVKVQYIVGESIKTVDLSILDQDNQPTTQLNSFANGYIQVSSQGLIPSVDYEVPTSNSYHVDLMKPNTQYTMKNMQGTFTIDGIQYNASVNGTFTSPSTLTNKFMITSVAQSQPMLLEGDVREKDIPYFKGIKSAFEGQDEIEIVSAGKNLYPYGDSNFIAPVNSWIYTNGKPARYGTNCKRGDGGNWFYLPAGKYSLTFNNPNTADGQTVQLIGEGEKIISPKDCAAGWYVLRIGAHHNQNICLLNIQIEESPSLTPTPHEPYKQNITKIPLLSPLRGLPNGVRDEIILDRVNHKAKIVQRVGEDLTQLETPITTEVNLEGYPYVYKGGHIFLNTEIAPTTEVTYSINQAHQIESSNEDILRHQKEINHLYGLIAQYVQVQYEAELIDIALQG